jgi:small subunit ribosomal protein S20
MAKTKSARKNARQAERRKAVNTARETRVKTYIKKVEAAIASGNKKSAQEAFKVAQPVLMRGVGQKVVHKNMVARKLSRLSARIKALT